ncbi:MAG: hypothetical protein ABI861_10895 [Panacibacter sp.]
MLLLLISELNIEGYSVLHAENINEAKTLLQEYPHFGRNAGCTIEVFETMAVPGM